MGKRYKHVYPEIKDWPISKLSEDRAQFIEEINEEVVNRLVKNYGENLHEPLTKTAYLELIRVKEEPWKVDPPQERQFWKGIQSKIVKNEQKENEVEQALNHKLLYSIVNRYSQEIVGTFKEKTFLFARRFLTAFFNRLLNTAASRNWERFLSNKHKLEDRLLLKGEIEKVRSLMKKGTVVVVPTHHSNLDSILIGYMLDTFAGLPLFSYGAGLNLYNTGYTAYYMNRMGAYRVDRRKKNPIYLETLKTMSTLSIERGVNTLFFPGGTRSRSGALETKFKLGLVGTATEAQRRIYEKEKDTKIFIVPLVVSYHFVLEANFLIQGHLSKVGKEKYLKAKDEFHSIRKQLSFLWNFFSASNEITMTFGKPMDVVGNFVDENGISFDQNNNPVVVRDYFLTDGEVTANKQREQEYTRHLGDRILERFFADNMVLTSHLVAYSAFKVLEKSNPDLDLYALLRSPTEDFIFPLDKLEKVVRELKEKLLEMEQIDKVKVSDQLRQLQPKEIISNGVTKMGTYHPMKPLKFNKKGELISERFRTLFFYHNRLENYGLEKFISFVDQPTIKETVVENKA